MQIVWHGAQEKYQNLDRLCGRFVSEFGMEAFPSVKTINSYLLNGTDDLDRYAQSSTIDFHNKALGHERRLATYMTENIPYSQAPLDYYVYCTQLMQAECLETAFRLWKREWKGHHREYCGGALVWQLNDCWPTQSWSIVDYYLRPKLAYYAIKHELADVTINMKRVVEESPSGEKVHKVQIFGTNLSLQDRECNLYVRSWDIITGARRNTCGFEGELKGLIRLPGNQSTESTVDEIGDSETAARTVVAASLIGLYDDGIDSHKCVRSVNWPEPLKYVRFQKPEHFSTKIVDSGEGNVVELGAEVPMKGIALQVNDEKGDNVMFDDNCVDLVPEETLRIGVRGLALGEEERITIRYLKAGIDL